MYQDGGSEPIGERELKSLMRVLGRASGSGGRGKEDRIKDAARNHLAKAAGLLHKLELFHAQFQPGDIREWTTISQLRGYIQLIKKHIDLVNRRILKGETIPHAEKAIFHF